MVLLQSDAPRWCILIGWLAASGRGRVRGTTRGVGLFLMPRFIHEQLGQKIITGIGAA